ncbi:quinone oxidoreductase PIG3, partial [Tanacetum coccineum]
WEQDGNNTEDDALVLGIPLLGEGHGLRFSEDDLLKQKEEKDDKEKFNLDNITHGKQVDVLYRRKRGALYEYIRLRDLYKSRKNGATFDRLEFDAKRRLKKKLTGNINFKFRGRFKGLHRLRWRRWKKIRGASGIRQFQMVDYRRLYIRRGKYLPPKGESECSGLECSGVVETVVNNVSRSKVGDQVCALLSSGGYAEKVVAPVGQVLSILSGISLKDVARFPEVAG